MSPARILVEDFVKIGLNQFFGAKHVYARIRAVQRGLTGVGAPRELVDSRAGLSLNSALILSEIPGPSQLVGVQWFDRLVQVIAVQVEQSHDVRPPGVVFCGFPPVL